MFYAKAGAVFYLLWSALHLIAAQKVFFLGQSLEAGMVQGRLYQDGFYLFFFAIAGAYIAIRYNWYNSSLGYWLNLILISAADIPYIAFILLPGYVPIVPGIIGPVLWMLAVLFSTLGIRASKTRTARVS